jgi:hypothetical protein
MPGPHGVISVRGDIKHAYDCDKESCKMTDRLTTSAELQELKNPPDLVMIEAKTSIQSEDSLNKTIPLSLDQPSMVAHMGNSLDPK